MACFVILVEVRRVKNKAISLKDAAPWKEETTRA
jgi:hypothetical protein